MANGLQQYGEDLTEGEIMEIVETEYEVRFLLAVTHSSSEKALSSVCIPSTPLWIDIFII